MLALWWNVADTCADFYALLHIRCARHHLFSCRAKSGLLSSWLLPFQFNVRMLLYQSWKQLSCYWIAALVIANFPRTPFQRHGDKLVNVLLKALIIFLLEQSHVEYKMYLKTSSNFIIKTNIYILIICFPKRCMTKQKAWLMNGAYFFTECWKLLVNW